MTAELVSITAADAAAAQRDLLAVVGRAQLSNSMRRQGDPLDADSHVYFMQRGTDGPVKIGRTVDIVRRHREIQTGCAEPVRLIGLVTFGGSAMERRLHDLFNNDRLEGEWFSPSSLLIDVARDFAGGTR